jgi:hypothetical protein
MWGYNSYAERDQRRAELQKKFWVERIFGKNLAPNYTAGE